MRYHINKYGDVVLDKPIFKPRVNYELKAYILNNCKDLLDYTKKCSRFEYIKEQLITNGLVLKSPNSDKELVTIYELKERFEQYGKKDLLYECLRINHATYGRVNRLKNRIESIITQNESTFLTLTFTDKALQETTAQERRIAVTRYLKQFGKPYIANIDFGIDETKTMREHYHCVIGSQSINYKLWKYGSVNGQKIHIKNSKALAKYVAKLTNHAIKEQAKRTSLIYSR